MTSQLLSPNTPWSVIVNQIPETTAQCSATIITTDISWSILNLTVSKRELALRQSGYRHMHFARVIWTACPPWLSGEASVRTVF